MAFTYEWIDGHRVEVNVASAFKRMASDFQRDTGCELHIRDATRTDQEQIDIFLSRYVVAGEVNGRYVYDTRVWNGTRYYRVSSEGTVAVPGTSNHQESGPNGPRSIDIYDSGDDAGVTVFGTARDGWMQRNAGNYGFENEGNNFNEPWHKTFRGEIGGTPDGSGGGSSVAFPARDAYGEAWVRSAQEKLIRLGYDLGPDGADGYDGAKTQAATSDVQKRVALEPDGVFGPDTNGRVDLLLSVVNGHKGFPLPDGYYFGPADGPAESISGVYSYGPDLKAWQQQMKNRGWAITPDGVYGPNTGDIAEAFQTEKHLTVDRKIGPATWNAAWEAPVTPPGGGGQTTPPVTTPGTVPGRNATDRSIKDIQAFLGVPQTGVWDLATANGVFAFQSKSNIDTDYVWGQTSDGLAFPPAGKKAFGVDFSEARPDVATLKARGVKFVPRYLWNPLYSDGRTNKGLSRAEHDGYVAAGIAVPLIYEEDGTELLGAFQAGVRVAQEAERHRLREGIPARPVYFNVDFDAKPEQISAILDALKGAASVVGLRRTGLYAGYNVVKAAFDAGVITFAMQTYGWSLGSDGKVQWDPRAQLRQWSNGQWGDSVDFQWAMADEFGQTPVDATTPPEPDAVEIARPKVEEMLASVNRMRIELEEWLA